MNLSVKDYFILNGSFLFFISLNNVFNLDLIDLTLIFSTFLYSIKWNKSEWLVPFFIFVWGIFQDILFSMNLGYSGSIYLLFYFLSQISSNYGVFEQQKIKFIVFAVAILAFFIFKNLFIYFIYQLNYLSLSEILSLLVILLLYFPLNSIILYIQKKYEKIR